AADRRSEGLLHRPGVFGADAGDRIHRDGGGARAAALGPARPRAGGNARPRGIAASVTGAVLSSPRRTGGAARSGSCIRRALYGRAPHGHPGVRAVRGEPAFPDGPRRHALVRPRGLLRPWRLRRGPAAVARASEDGACAGARAVRGRGGCAGLRLVLRAAFGGLPGDADPRVRPDCLVRRLSVGRAHWRLEWPDRRLARAVAVLEAGVLLPDSGALPGRGRVPVAADPLALRLCPARRARL